MNRVNIYPTVVFDLNQRVKDYLDQLNSLGQIDVDERGYPFLLNVEKEGSNHIVTISRDNKAETFIINSRKQKEPVLSWNKDDGWKRPEIQKTIVMNQPDENPRKERKLRSAMESYQIMVEQMLRPKRIKRHK